MHHHFQVKLEDSLVHEIWLDARWRIRNYREMSIKDAIKQRRYFKASSHGQAK